MEDLSDAGIDGEEVLFAPFIQRYILLFSGLVLYSRRLSRRPSSISTTHAITALIRQ